MKSSSVITPKQNKRQHFVIIIVFLLTIIGLCQGRYSKNLKSVQQRMIVLPGQANPTQIQSLFQQQQQRHIQQQQQPQQIWKVPRGGSSSAFSTPTKTVNFGPSQVQQQSSSKSSEKQNGVSTKEMIDAFLTRDSRNTFIARVYAILAGQLLVTIASCLIYGLYPPLANFRLQYDPVLAAIPLVGILASTIAWFRICSSVKARRESPEKWWWLTIYTLGEAISVGFLSSFYTMNSVMSAMGATAIASITVSAYTIMQKNPKYDLSQWGATLSSWAMILFVYIMLGIVQDMGLLPIGFLPYSDMVYSFFASILFSAFLAHHTKLIVGGKHTKYRITDKDYIFGAMCLYTDIVNIFLNLLQLLGEMKDD